MGSQAPITDRGASSAPARSGRHPSIEGELDGVVPVEGPSGGGAFTSGGRSSPRCTAPSAGVSVPAAPSGRRRSGVRASSSPLGEPACSALPSRARSGEIARPRPSGESAASEAEPAGGRWEVLHFLRGFALELPIFIYI